MKFGVKVMPRDVILDTQGRAVESSLKQAHFELSSCRVGKYIEIEINAESEGLALEKIKAMTEHLLYNPLIEKYEIEKIK